MAKLQAVLKKRRRMEEGTIWASMITPQLYLGRGQDAKNLKQLQQHGITHILNVADDVENFHPNYFTYANLNVTDFGGDKGIRRVFPPARDFVKTALSTRRNTVLVHCANGSNRSATVVIALLMMLPSLTEAKRSLFKKERERILSESTLSEMDPEKATGRASSEECSTSSEMELAKATGRASSEEQAEWTSSERELAKTTGRASSEEHADGTPSEITPQTMSKMEGGLSLKEAYDHVKRSHSATAPLRDNRMQLVMFEKELKGSSSMTEEDFQ